MMPGVYLLWPYGNDDINHYDRFKRLAQESRVAIFG